MEDIKVLNYGGVRNVIFGTYLGRPIGGNGLGKHVYLSKVYLFIKFKFNLTSSLVLSYCLECLFV